MMVNRGCKCMIGGYLEKWQPSWILKWLTFFPKKFGPKGNVYTKFVACITI